MAGCDGPRQTLLAMSHGGLMMVEMEEELMMVEMEELMILQDIMKEMQQILQQMPQSLDLPQSLELDLTLQSMEVEMQLVQMELRPRLRRHGGVAHGRLANGRLANGREMEKAATMARTRRAKAAAKGGEIVVAVDATRPPRAKATSDGMMMGHIKAVVQRAPWHIIHIWLHVIPGNHAFPQESQHDFIPRNHQFDLLRESNE